jgi:PAS domain S-box-containing protein
MGQEDYAPNNQSQDWHKVDARVLGQILAAQNVVFALPDTTRIAEFYAQALVSMPGIRACRVCLGGASVQAGELASGTCAECDTLRRLARKDDTLIPAISDFRCALADQPDMRVMAIDSYQHHFGFFVIKLENAAVFEAYQPFVGNLSNFVAIILENRLQKDLLQKARDELESKVAERTRDLTAANEALDAARLAALNIMRDAIEARQRAEQANSDLQREVAERQRAEQDIVLMSFALDNVHEAAFLIDEQARFQFVNEEACRILGYSRTELLELNVADVDPDFPPERWPAHWQELKTKRSLIFEGRHKTKDSRIFPVEVHANFFQYGGRAYNLALVRDITERKRAEEALQEERKLFIGGPSVAFKWKAAEGWPVEYVSPNILNQFGYVPEELTSGKIPYASIVHPHDLPRVAEEVKTYSERNVPFFEQEYRLARADGKYRWVYDFTVVVRDSAGVITHYTGHITDITARKQAEEALRDSERRLAEAQRIAHVGYWERNFEAGRIILSDEACRIFGLPPQEVPFSLEEWHQRWLTLIHPDDRSRASQAAADAIGDGPPYSIDYRIIRPNGELRFVHSEATVRRDESGRPRYMLGMMQDITERKRVEEALSASEAELRTLINAMTDIIFVGNSAGRYLKVANTSSPLLYKPAEELVGKTLHEVFPKDQADFFLSHIRQALNTRHSVSFEYSLLIGDKPMWFYATISPMTADEILMVARDITERKQAEEERLAHLKFLESLDRVNRAMQGTNDLEQMMSNVFDVVLSIFECDRVSLVYPCDPAATSWTVPMERTRSEYPGVAALGIEIPLDSDVARTFQIMRAINGPVKFGPESEYPLPAEVSQRFGFRSFIGMALYPKVDKPWEFVLHQCSYSRVWTSEEERLFQEIGRRLTDALSSLLAYRDLRANETRFRTFVDHATDAFFLHDERGTILDVNRQACESLGYSREELIGMTPYDFDAGADPAFLDQINPRLDAGEMIVFDTWHRRKDGTVIPVEVRSRPFWQDERRFSVSLARDMTERNRAQEALTLFRALIDRTNDAIEVIDPETGRFLDVNEQAYHSLGYTREEFLNLTVPDIDPLVTGRSMQEVLEELQRSGSLTYESQHRRKDGSVFPIEINATYIRLDRDYVLTVARDITERKQAEMQLLASEQLFRALVENSPDFIARYDREFHRIYVNPAIQKLFGSPAEDVLGKTPADQSPVYAPQIYISHLQQVIETVTETAVEMPFRTAQGEMHWGHMRFVPEFGPDGRVASVLAIGRDIHDIKENERRFRMLAENFPDFVVRFDRKGRHTYVNPAVEKAFGIPADAIVGKTLQELPLHRQPEQNAALLALIHRVFAEGVANESEAHWDTEAGERIFEIRLAPEKDATGNVVSVLGLARDITERKRAEEEIRRLNQELEQRVIDRTAQLEAANKELEAFAYSVSHDLRAPLRHIDGFLELLHKRTVTLLDEQSQHYMDTISDATKRMGTLIDDLLSFSRMGRYEMSRMQVDLAELAQEVIWELAPETHGRDIHWRVARLPKASGDRALLRLVLVNLLSNALKFTQPREQTEIEIGFTRGENETIFFVRDNGVGFDMQYANRLFGVFQRLHHVDEFEGTGIGLANVRRIIARHGGRTWAEGAVNQGATFYFSLPQPVQGV